MRIEKDNIGTREIPKNALFGIHSLRATENFPDKTRFSYEWYKAMGLVKQACYSTYRAFKEGVSKKYGDKINDFPITFIDSSTIDALESAAMEVGQGKYFDHFIVPAIQGGAGTSINMNVNEIIANVATQKLYSEPGKSLLIDPIEHANIFQSTNDVVPTALRVAVMQQLNMIEMSINNLRQSIEHKEQQYRDVLRMGYTQMQAAVPSSYGKLFSAYNDALSRDWWRISKCLERIKTVNLGGSAIGTSIVVPRFFVMEVCNHLQRISGLPVTRAENLSDATSNLDSLVEVHAILKTHAVNLEKIANDLRLLASDIAHNQIEIPAVQDGSSIMPGKINPVICEYVVSVAHKVYANDKLVTSLSAQGCLELNAYLPTIGNALLDTLLLLISANDTLKNNLIDNLIIHIENQQLLFYKNPTIATALIPYIGYHHATTLANCMHHEKLDIYQANQKLKLIDEERLTQLLKPDVLLKSGYAMDDILTKK